MDKSRLRHAFIRINGSFSKEHGKEVVFEIKLNSQSTILDASATLNFCIPENTYFTNKIAFIFELEYFIVVSHLLLNRVIIVSI